MARPFCITDCASCQDGWQIKISSIVKSPASPTQQKLFAAVLPSELNVHRVSIHNSEPSAFWYKNVRLGRIPQSLSHQQNQLALSAYGESGAPSREAN